MKSNLFSRETALLVPTWERSKYRRSTTAHLLTSPSDATICGRFIGTTIADPQGGLCVPCMKTLKRFQERIYRSTKPGDDRSLYISKCRRTGRSQFSWRTALCTFDNYVIGRDWSVRDRAVYYLSVSGEWESAGLPPLSPARFESTIRAMRRFYNVW